MNMAGESGAVIAPVTRRRWSKRRAGAWYARQPWLIGSNYNPSTAINQLEMWQAETFDSATIDRELGWAAGIGMNVMRVFLHNLLWEQDAAGFKARVDEVLGIADRHGIRIMPVLFDSCWNPHPSLGPQQDPVPGVHNSGWVQSPGHDRLVDKVGHALLEAYVRDIVGSFGQDPRVVVWDVWNEPCNPGGGNYQPTAEKFTAVETLLAQSFAWARAAAPMQPLTSGLWQHDDWSPSALTAIETIQIRESDVLSFHDYSPAEGFLHRIRQLQAYDRPVLCTEYMARGIGSTFHSALPVGKAEGVAMINWGMVDGRSQTRLPWDSYQSPYVDREPEVWFHEIFHADGRPYCKEEVALIRRLTGAAALTMA
jgi:hypothetical protein